MWPFPQPQFKSESKGERWEFRSNCKRNQDLPVTNMVWGRGRSSNFCLTFTWHSMAQDAGSFPCACSCPNPVGDTPNRAPDGSHFEEKGGKDSKQQLKLFRKKQKINWMHHKGEHQLENMPDRLDGCREWQGEIQRKAVEMWISYCTPVRSYEKPEQRDVERARHEGHAGRSLASQLKNSTEGMRGKMPCQYNVRGKVWVIQTMRITIAPQVQIDTPPHQHTRH